MTRLRAARSTDAGSVGGILSEFIDTTPWVPRIHTRAEDIAHAAEMIERGWVTVAEQAGTVVGFSALDGAELNALYVAGEVRGGGIGSTLLARVKRQNAVVSLWTFQANRRARAFYETHGFVEVARGDGTANDEALPDIRFEWQEGAV